MSRRTDVTMPALPLAAARKAVNDRADDAITDQAFWDLIQDLGGGHFRVNSVERALGTVIAVPASKIGGVSDTASDALQAQSPDGGVETAGDTSASTDGTATTITVADGAPSVTAATPVGTGSGAEPVSYGAMVIAGGATLELSSAYSGTVAFAGATGTLKIDNSSSFSGTITGQLAIGDVIDLTDITAGANATITYSGNNSPGTLTVSDGTHTTNMALQGNYSLANFTVSSDGHGGTLVIDPLPTTINGSYQNGLNYAWNAYAADWGTGGYGDLTDFPKISSDLTTLASEGVSTVRWWVFGDGRYNPTFNADGTVAGLSANFYADLDQSLQLAAQNHQKLLLTLNDFTMFNFAQDGGSGVTLGGHANIITDPAVRQSFLDNALKPLLQHIAASPYASAVLGYDIINEPEDQIAGGYNGSDFFRGPAQFALSDVQSFVAQAASYIHTYGGPGALATLGSAMPQWAPLWMGLGLDFYEVHYYSWMDFNGPGTGLPNANDITSDTGVHLDKPVMVGEFQTADTSYGLNDTAVGSAEWYLNTIQSRGYAGELGWSLTAGDSASNWTAFQPVFTDWVQHHQQQPGNPIITSFSPDSGTVGDGITNATTLTLVGSAAPNSTVNIFDGATQVGTGTVNVNGAWSVTTSALANGSHSLTAKDGSLTSAPLIVTVDTVAPNAPAINSDTVSGNVVTLNGSAEAGSKVTVFDGTFNLGTVTANGSSAWTFTTGALGNGNHSFTANAADAAGNTSAASAPLSVTISSTGPLVTNGDFETGNLNGWTLSGNTTFNGGPAIFITNDAHTGSDAVDMGSVGADGIISQFIPTVAGQQYTLDFWLKNLAGGPNDFGVKWGGVTEMRLTNLAAQGYTEYTMTLTATGTSTSLEFDARQDPADWNLDSVSVTPVGTQPPATDVTQVVELPSNGDLNAGETVTLTLSFNAPVTVTGTPTLTLNDGGIATYTDGSGASALNFSYTVGSTDTNVSVLAATGVNLPNGATVKDGGGNVVNLSLTGLTQTGPQIDTTIPAVSSVAESPSSGVLNVGNTVTLTLNLSEVVTVTGTPTLTLNDGGIATYTDGSGTSALNFIYTVGSTDSNVSALAATGVNLPNGATVEDGGGNVANLSLTGLTQTGPQIDTTIPDPDGPEPPVLTITSNALTVNAGGSVSLPISVAAVDSDDMISVKISGLMKYESITDNLDNITFRPKHGSVTLTAAEVNSGLTLNSTYGGTGHPVNTLTVTATNSTASETGTSAQQTITVTDPPANSSTNIDGVTTLFAQTAAALLAQFGAAGFQNGPNDGGPVGAPLSQAHSANDTSFLTKPHS